MKQVTKEEIIQIIKTILKDGDLYGKTLDESVGLDDQGIDSLDMMNIIFQIQDDYQVEISDESVGIGEWSSIDKIIHNLDRMLN